MRSYCPVCGYNGNFREKNGELFCPCCGNMVHQNKPANNDELNGKEIFNLNYQFVVEIFNSDFTTAGSGVIISKDGYIITNCHVVTDNNGKVEKGINVVIPSTNQRFKAKVVSLGRENALLNNGLDIALLKIEKYSNANEVKFAKENSIFNGDKIYCIGNSLGEGTCITSGIVSDNKRLVNGSLYVMHDASANPGNSGCPIFNEKGELISIHTASRRDAVGMKFSISLDLIRNFLKEFERKSRINIIGSR